MSKVEKLFVAMIIVSMIILIYLAVVKYEGFELETSQTPSYVRNFYVKKLAQTLAEDPRNSAGEYVEFFDPRNSAGEYVEFFESGNPLIVINRHNCVFKYDHMNEKTYTIKIKPGEYTGPELAKELENALNNAEDGWWVAWDKKHNRFALGSYGFKYRRWYHPQSIYQDIGIKCTPEFGLMKNMTEWMDSEVGNCLM